MNGVPSHVYITTSYLGYLLDVYERRVVIFDAQRRRLGEVTSMKKARLFVRGYRKEAA